MRMVLGNSKSLPKNHISYMMGCIGDHIMLEELEEVLNYTASSLRTMAVETTNKSTMLELSKSDHWGVRWNLTKNKNTPKDILIQMANDICPHVLMGVINHDNIDNETAIDVYLDNKSRLQKFNKVLMDMLMDNSDKDVVAKFIQSRK